MQRITSPLVGVVLAVMPAGCGAILHGSHQEVMIQSAPDSATVRVIPGGEQFTTPTPLRLTRKNSYTLTFSKPGYSDAFYSIKSGASTGILIVDILFTGLIGVAVDAATGDWNKLRPKAATVTLTKVDGAAAGPDVILVTLSEQRKAVRVAASASGVRVGVQER